MMSNLSAAMPGIVITSLQTAGKIRLRVISNSMFPFLQRGDWITVQRVEVGRSPQVGDIVLYRRGDNFIIHRVIRLEAQTVICKGDFNRTCDQPLELPQILGILQKVEKGKIRFSMQWVNRIFRRISAIMMDNRKYWRKN